MGEKLSEDDRKRRRSSVVWYGTCTRENSKVVKEICAASDDGSKATMWDNERKLWGTLRLENVVSLIASGMWFPSGLPVSLTDAVGDAAKTVVNSRKQKLLDEETRKEQKAAEERDKKVAEGALKEQQRKERENKSLVLSEADIDFCESTYGLRREITAISHTFGFLGPRTTVPLTRLTRWFNFGHNREAGAAAVVARDFEQAFAQHCRNRAEAEAAAAGVVPAKKRRKVIADANVSMAELRRREAERVEAIKAKQLQAQEGDAHARALDASIAKSSAAFRRSAIYARVCTKCDVRPINQFLECGCGDDEARGWKICDACNSIWHPSKMPCLC
jgi:hypothetical protein